MESDIPYKPLNGILGWRGVDK